MSVTSALATLATSMTKHSTALVSALQRHKPSYSVAQAIAAGGNFSANVAGAMPLAAGNYDWPNCTVLLKVNDPDSTSPTYNKPVDASGVISWTQANGVFTFYNNFETALTVSIDIRVFKKTKL